MSSDNNDIKKRLNYFEKKVNEMNIQINDIKGGTTSNITVDAIKKQLISVQEKYQNIDKEINGVKNGSNNTVYSIDNLKIKLNYYENKLKELNLKIEDINNNIEIMKDNINTGDKNNRDDIIFLKNQNIQIENTQNNINENILKIPSKEEVNNVEVKFTTFFNKYNSDRDSIKNDIRNLENKINSLKTNNQKKFYEIEQKLK